MKITGNIRNRAIIALGAVALVLGYQNCSDNGFKVFTENSVNSINSEPGPLPSASPTPTPPPGETPQPPTPPAPTVLTTGYVFSGEYRASPTDNTGTKICDYPSGANCHSDAEGKSKGAMVTAESKLSPKSPVQKISFEFMSNGFLANNRDAHFAIGLRGNTTRDSKNDPIAVNGRGFIIGQLGSDGRNAGNLACSNDMAQIETYHGDIYLNNPANPANHIFQDTCSDPLFVENRWYRMELYVSRDRKIGYKIYDGSSTLLHSVLMQDPYDYISLDLNDWFMGYVFNTRVTSPAQNWKLTLNNISFSESNSNIESFFTEPLFSFYLGGIPIPDNTLVSLDEITNKTLGVGNFPSLRTRIYGCAGPAAAVDAGACQRVDEFRVINRAGDASFVSVGNKLNVIPSSLASYPSNTYKLVLRANPGNSFKQITVRVQK